MNIPFMNSFRTLGKKKKMFRKLFTRTLQLIVHKREPLRQFTGPLNSIVILAQEKIGDSILLTPLLRNLRHSFPHLEIHLICFSEASTAFFRNDPHVTAIHSVKNNIVRYYNDVLSKEFDLLFNTKDSPSTNFLIQTILIRARFKAGHAHPYHEGLFNHLIKIEYHTRMALKNCSLLSVLSVRTREKECRPYLPPAPVSGAITRFSEKINTDVLIGLNISAGSPLRCWTEERWHALIKGFPDMQFVIFSAPGDTNMKMRLEQHDNVTVSPPTVNIYEVGELVKHLRLLVTPDTSLVHVASCCNIPVIGLYTKAPQDLSRFGPYLVDFEIITSSTSQVSDIEVEVVASVMQNKLLQQLDMATGGTTESSNKKTEFS
ncbi:MAG: glycosyltransferase family 9 protein [Chlorobiaceae bacterium]|nr:glycosyltransferase family 9 protein [Chlorobiaceae bacterium]